MHYQEYTPDVSLQGEIECYWALESTGAHAGFHTVYPDGCMDIIFNFGDALIRRQHDVLDRNEAGAFVVGNMLRPIESRLIGKTSLLGVRFKPGGMSRFFRFAMDSFTDVSVSLYDVDKGFKEVLVEQLYDLPLRGRIDLLNEYFKKRMTAGQETWRGCLQEVVAGRKPISVIAREAGVSEKYLQRKFGTHVGVTPKQLSQVLRFRELRNHLKDCSYSTLMDLAWDMGFTDHAHLTKVFKSYAGVSPKEYLGTFV